MDSTPNIKTRFFIISDTHGINIPSEYTQDANCTQYADCAQYADVAIHCGDLTTESKIHEFKSTIQLLERIHAPLKLVIPGNHDFTIDTPIFQKKVAEAHTPLDPALVRKEYGDYEEARSLFHNTSIIFLEEGTHHFTLQNGASLTVYASPYTPSLGDWGFQYHPNQGHDFDIPPNVDVVITHGPPKGIMDYANSGQRTGCPGLFGAVARARPRMHCFGHIHEGWGAKLVAWRDKVSENPSHLTDIDNGGSAVIGKLSDLARRHERDRNRCYLTSHCADDPKPLHSGSQTLFVNAAVEGSTDHCPVQPPWLVDIELSKAT